MKKSILFSLIVVMIISSFLSLISCSSSTLDKIKSYLGLGIPIDDFVFHTPMIYGFISNSNSLSIKNLLNKTGQVNSDKLRANKKCTFSLDETLYADAYYGNKSYTVGKATFYITAEDFEITDEKGNTYPNEHSEHFDLDDVKYKYKDTGEHPDTFYREKYSLKYTGNYEEKVGHISFNLVLDKIPYESIGVLEYDDVWYYSISEEDKKITFTPDPPEGYCAYNLKAKPFIRKPDTLYDFVISKGNDLVIDCKKMEIPEGSETKNYAVYVRVDDPNVYICPAYEYLAGCIDCYRGRCEHAERTVKLTENDSYYYIMLDGFIPEKVEQAKDLQLWEPSSLKEYMCTQFIVDTSKAEGDINLRIIVTTDYPQDYKNIPEMFED